MEKSNTSEFPHSKMISVVVEGSSTKRYHNTIGILVRLNKCARLLLDYIVEEMDEKNKISNNRLLKDGFNDVLKKTGQTPYGAITINKAFTELANVNLLISGKKGTYQISPWFFFNGSEVNRQKLIRKILEKPNAALAAATRRQYYLDTEE